MAVRPRVLPQQWLDWFFRQSHEDQLVTAEAILVNSWVAHMCMSRAHHRDYSIREYRTELRRLVNMFHVELDPAALIEKIGNFTNEIETHPTNKWCKCEWLVHPEDYNLQEGQCRICRLPREMNFHNEEFVGGEEYHPFRGRRLRRGDQHPLCVAHTKEGLILGFFEYLKDQEGDNESRSNPPA